MSKPSRHALRAAALLNGGDETGDETLEYAEIIQRGIDNALRPYQVALEESVKLQSFYGQLLNTYDGGERLKFDDAKDWIMRLQQIGKIPKRL